MLMLVELINLLFIIFANVSIYQRKRTDIHFTHGMAHSNILKARRMYQMRNRQRMVPYFPYFINTYVGLCKTDNF